MMKIKLAEKNTDLNLIHKQKREAAKYIRPEILRIIEFLMRKEVKHVQNLLLSLLR